MRGRAEVAVAMEMMKKSSSDRMIKVSQAVIGSEEDMQRMDKNSLAHTKWNCTYHNVFIPKYRRKVMYGEVRRDIREIIRTLCGYKGVEIVEGIEHGDRVPFIQESLDQV